MSQGDLLLAGIASAMMKSATSATATPSGGTPTTGSSPVTATFTAEQIDQLAGALTEAVGRIEVATPQVTLSGNIQATLSPEQVSQITNAIASAGVSGSVKMKQVQNRFLQTPNTPGTTIHTLAGGAPNGSFPNIVLVDSIQFTDNVSLIAIVLSVSMLNTGTEPMGIYAGRVQGNVLNLTSPADPTIRATDIYLSLMTHNNSTGFTNAPASRTSSIAFSPATAPVRVPSGQAIGIYACCQNIATTLLTADLSVFYFVEDTTSAVGG
jgi:hypothetical protein